MGAAIIELISSIVNITGNPTFDTIIFAFIGLISGSIAFGLVGMLFDFTGNYNSRDMSEMHWGIRVIMFCLLTFIMVKIAQVFRWLFSPPQLYIFIAVIVLLIVVISVISIYKSKKKLDHIEKSIKEISPQESQKVYKKTLEKVDTVTRQDIEICPYCNGVLVNRTGRYGKFLGCSNFPECKYTRKQ